MIYPLAGSMDNKYFKIAVILALTSFVLVSLVFAVVVMKIKGPEWLGKFSGPSCTQQLPDGTGR